MSQLLHNSLSFTHELIKKTVKPGDTVIDATVGNGGDTLLLADLVGEKGNVIGFDIQNTAIANTTEKLENHNLEDRVSLHQTGHEYLLSVYSKPESVSVIVFNLGYLPTGDKRIITSPDTTLKAIESGLSVLKKNGLVLIMIYYGHDGGLDEKEAVLNYVRSLPQTHYNVLKYDFINQKNNPPFLLAIEKRK